MLLKYNDPETVDQRSAVKPLTLEEEEKVINFLNQGFILHNLYDAQIELLQRFIWNYENLNHFKSYNSGNQK